MMMVVVMMGEGSPQRRRWSPHALTRNSAGMFFFLEMSSLLYDFLSLCLLGGRQRGDQISRQR